MTKRKTQTYRGVDFVHPKPYTEEFKSWMEYAPTLKQFRNLLDMAKAIQNSPPPKFDMGDFGFIGNIDDNQDFYEKYNVSYSGSVHEPLMLRKISRFEDVNVCGTSCCAIGTAAFHGVGRLTKDMNWKDYSKETFDLVQNSNLWEWLFGGDWKHVDNTPEGAVARILMFVTEGPEAIDKHFDKEKLWRDESSKIMKASYQKYLGIIIS